MKKIFITGTFLSGKQTLLYLLDNHHEVISNFIHDQLISFIIALNSKIEKKINSNIRSDDELNLDIIEIVNYAKQKTKISFNDFVNCLNQSNIQHLERLALLKIMPNYFSSINRNYLNFDFNFENFKKEIKSEIFLNSKKIFQIEEIFEIFIHKFIFNWNNLNNKKNNLKKISFATKLPNNIESIKFVINQKFDSKIIYVDRDLLSVLKSRTLATLKIKNENVEKFNLFFNNQLRTNFIERVKFSKAEIQKIKNIEDKIYITSLEKLTQKTKEEILKIIDFLGLSRYSTEIKPTYCGNEIGLDHVNKINDDEFDISEENYIFFLFRTKSITSSFSLLIKNLKYLKIFLTSIYLKFKFRNIQC